jgi:hypothetical protein
MQAERRSPHDRRSQDRRGSQRRTLQRRGPHQRRSTRRKNIEELMDRFVADTFPASDPPRWESLRERLDHDQPS